MRVAFRKMHGCGNDFVVFDERAGALALTPARIAALADRRTGIGCDQLISIEPPPPGSEAAGVMRIRNPDGSEAGACGNATRCVAQLLFMETGRPCQIIRTLAGDLPAEILPDGRVTVDMGRARLEWEEIPLARPMDTLHLDLALGAVADPAAANLGNPHVTFFVPALAAIPAEEVGFRLERHALFPERVNVGFAQVLSTRHIRLRVWERGAGLTRACGSGACAAVVNAHRRGLAGSSATVELDGGVLDIELRGDGHVLMTGPVATAFSGEIDLEAWPL